MMKLRSLPVSMGKILGGLVLVALLPVWLISTLIEGPLRRPMENGMNSSLKGYNVSLGEVEFHPVGFSVTLRDLEVRQNAYPKQPVAHSPACMPTSTGGPCQHRTFSMHNSSSFVARSLMR